MLNILKLFYLSVSFGAFLVSIFYLPVDVVDWETAAKPWEKVLAMFNQNTALWVFSLIALAYIFWIDIRPFVIKWKKAKLNPITISDKAFWTHWLATKFDLGESGKTHAIISDPEINSLQRDVSRLIEMFTGYANFESERDELACRITRLQSSDHLIWHDNPAKQLRRDFLNCCGRCFDDKKRNREDCNEIRVCGNELFDSLQN